MRALAAIALALAACGQPLEGPADLASRPRDLGARDLAVRLTDGGADDLSAIPGDLGPLDMSGPCQGGYLNSDLGAACPLSCSAAVKPVPDEGAVHVPFGTIVTYKANPPASGPHWPSPAPWGVHSDIVAREWWVHNLEHGGVVLLYNCPRQGDAAASTSDAGPPPPDACPSEIATYAQIYATHPQDNWYDQILETRILVTADPLLPTRFAAVAWDWVWTGDTLDQAAVECFVAARYGRGPENAP